MTHEQYRVSPDRVAEQDLRKYNWEILAPRFLAPAIIIDDDLYFDIGDAVLEVVHRLAERHDKPLQKVEIISGSDATEGRNQTILVRWTSSQGVYEEEFEVYEHPVIKIALFARPAPIRR